jgi:hypothetical protein
MNEGYVIQVVMVHRIPNSFDNRSHFARHQSITIKRNQMNAKTDSEINEKRTMLPQTKQRRTEPHLVNT